MLRACTFLNRNGISNPRQFLTVQLPRKLRPIRNSSTENCRDQLTCPPPECPPKKRCLMDLHPVPCGSWKEDYDARNAIYNRQLMIAAGATIITTIAVLKVGWIKGYPEIGLFFE